MPKIYKHTTLHPTKSARQAAVGLMVAVLTLFYPVGAYVFAEGSDVTPTLPATEQTEASPVVLGEPAQTQPAPAQEEPVAAISVATVAVTEEPPVVETTAPPGQTVDATVTATIANTITSTAQSGDASVVNNTLAGSAISGDALAMATVFNMVQSSVSSDQGGIVSFNLDIPEDVYGDMTIDPSALSTVQSMSPEDTSGSQVTLNTTVDQQITNDISLTARSGDALVGDNGNAGSATSGSATAVANIVNVMNSAISSGKSFVGTINIRGNLNGDILLPPGMLDTLLTATGTSAATPSTTTTTNQTVKNNIESNATSGAATVDNNGMAGSATTGTGETSVTIMNLTGRQVVAANSLLVFVNVMGKWVGAIMDAPNGATSAALASKVAQNTCSGCNGLEGYNATVNQQITNNVTVNAQSGTATVSSNGSAGGARSGDAKTAVNIANIQNASFSLADWFGVLFINVFGSWNGSFGIDTAAGNSPDSGAAPGNSTDQTTGPAVRVFRFEAAGSGGLRPRRVASVGGAGEQAPPQVQAATVQEDQLQEPGSVQEPAKAFEIRLLFILLGLTAGVILLVLERVLSSRQGRAA